MDVRLTKDIRVPVRDPQVGQIKIDKFLGVRVGQMAPDFNLTNLEGAPLRLSDLRGKVVLVEFWATWCGPCIVELPNIKRAFERFGKNDRFVVVGLSLDEKEDVVRKFALKQGIDWPLAVVGPEESHPVRKAYNVSLIPATFLIDAQGKVVATDSRGLLLEKQLHGLLEAPVAQQRPADAAADQPRGSPPGRI